MKRVDVVYTLITDASKSKILMVNNIDSKDERWTLPGGAVESGETLEAAAIREAKEETGYDIQVHGVVAVNEAVLEKENVHGIFITFRAEIIGGHAEIVRPNEIGQIEWIEIEKADELMPYYKESLRSIVQREIEVTYYDEGRI